MRSVFAILSVLATLNLRQSVERAKRNGLYMGVAGLFFATGYVFLLIALTVFIARHFGPMAAILGLGLLFVLMGIAVLIAQNAIGARERRRDAARRATMESLLAMGAAQLPVKSTLVGLVLAAITAGGAAYALKRDDTDV